MNEEYILRLYVILEITIKSKELGRELSIPEISDITMRVYNDLKSRGII